MTETLAEASTAGKPVADRRWVPVLRNRVAGPHARDLPFAEAITAVARLGFEVEVFSDRGEFLAALADPRRRAECRCIVAAGGDGTVRWLINEERAFPIALFPIGSENLFARCFGIDRSAECLSSLVERGVERRLDLGVVNGRYFALMAGIGIDADVVRRVHRRRLGHVSRWDYLRAIMKSLRRFRYPRLQVLLDDDESPIQTTHLILFNLPEYALGFPICRSADPEDGQLDAVVFQVPGLFGLLRYLVWVALGKHFTLPDVLHRRVRVVEVRSEERVSVQTDGDPEGGLPAHITVAPQGLRLLVPPGRERSAD